MLKPYKIIKRRFFNYDNNEYEEGLFLAVGIWADGHLAYSRVNENRDPINEEEEGAYAQIRDNGRLFMERI